MRLEQYLRDILANNTSTYPVLKCYITEANAQEVIIQLYPEGNVIGNPKSFKTSGTTIDEKIFTKD